MDALRMSSQRDLRNLDSERIFFELLSKEAKEKLLNFKGIKSPTEENWDIFPICHHYESISELSQSEIDEMALMAVGFYQL